jgi:hypothetical protein
LLEAETNALIKGMAGVAVSDDAGETLTTGAEAFFGFVEEHPNAWRMLFREVPGEPEIAKMHRALQRRGDRVIAELLAAVPGLRSPSTPHARETAADMVAVAVRAVVNGLAGWWWDHSETPRSEVVSVAVDLLAHGLLPGVVTAETAKARGSARRRGPEPGPADGAESGS